MLDAADQLRGNLARAFDDFGQVKAEILDADAKRVGMFDEIDNFRRAQQSLGRNTSPVQTNPAKIIALDQRDLQPKLRRAYRRDIATGSAADDDKICLRHDGFPFWLWRQVFLYRKSSKFSS